MIGLDQGITLEPHEYVNMDKSIKRISSKRYVEMGLQDSVNKLSIDISCRGKFFKKI